MLLTWVASPHLLEWKESYGTISQEEGVQCRGLEAKLQPQLWPVALLRYHSSSWGKRR